MVKVVLNRKFGGFGLSQKVFERLIEQGWTVTHFREDHTPIDLNADLLLRPVGTTYGYVKEGLYYLNWWKHEENSNEFRTRPEIVALVEELKEEASGDLALLVIEEVNDDYYWEIHSFDGVESIKYGSLKEEW